MTKPVMIRLFTESGGYLNDLGVEFTSDDFGGGVPMAGDLIVSPGVVAGRERREPANREVMEVLKRYHPLGQSQVMEQLCVVLVVEVRTGLPGEVDILGA